MLIVAGTITNFLVLIHGPFTIACFVADERSTADQTLESASPLSTDFDLFAISDLPFVTSPLISDVHTDIIPQIGLFPAPFLLPHKLTGIAAAGLFCALSTTLA